MLIKFHEIGDPKGIGTIQLEFFIEATGISGVSRITLIKHTQIRIIGELGVVIFFGIVKSSKLSSNSLSI